MGQLVLPDDQGTRRWGRAALFLLAFFAFCVYAFDRLECLCACLCAIRALISRCKWPSIRLLVPEQLRFWQLALAFCVF